MTGYPNYPSYYVLLGIFDFDKSSIPDESIINKFAIGEQRKGSSDEAKRNQELAGAMRKELGDEGKWEAEHQRAEKQITDVIDRHIKACGAKGCVLLDEDIEALLGNIRRDPVIRQARLNTNSKDIIPEGWITKRLNALSIATQRPANYLSGDSTIPAFGRGRTLKEPNLLDQFEDFEKIQTLLDCYDADRFFERGFSDFYTLLGLSLSDHSTISGEDLSRKAQEMRSKPQIKSSHTAHAKAIVELCRNVERVFGKCAVPDYLDYLFYRALRSLFADVKESCGYTGGRLDTGIQLKYFVGRIEKLAKTYGCKDGQYQDVAEREQSISYLRGYCQQENIPFGLPKRPVPRPTPKPAPHPMPKPSSRNGTLPYFTFLGTSVHSAAELAVAMRAHAKQDQQAVLRLLYPEFDSKLSTWLGDLVDSGYSTIYDLYKAKNQDTPTARFVALQYWLDPNHTPFWNGYDTGRLLTIIRTANDPNGSPSTVDAGEEWLLSVWKQRILAAMADMAPTEKERKQYHDANVRLSQWRMQFDGTVRMLDDPYERRNANTVWESNIAQLFAVAFDMYSSPGGYVNESRALASDYMNGTPCVEPYRRIASDILQSGPDRLGTLLAGWGILNEVTSSSAWTPGPASTPQPQPQPQPTPAPAHDWVGDVWRLFNADDYDAAVIAAANARAHLPNDPTAYEASAWVMLMKPALQTDGQSNADKALTFAKVGLTLQGTTKEKFDLHCVKGIAQMCQGDLNGALSTLRYTRTLCNGDSHMIATMIATVNEYTARVYGAQGDDVNRARVCIDALRTMQRDKANWESAQFKDRCSELDSHIPQPVGHADDEPAYLDQCRKLYKEIAAGPLPPESQKKWLDHYRVEIANCKVRIEEVRKKLDDQIRVVQADIDRLESEISAKEDEVKQLRGSGTPLWLRVVKGLFDAIFKYGLYGLLIGPFLAWMLWELVGSTAYALLYLNNANDAASESGARVIACIPFVIVLLVYIWKLYNRACDQQNEEARENNTRRTKIEDEIRLKKKAIADNEQRIQGFRRLKQQYSVQ